MNSPRQLLLVLPLLFAEGGVASRLAPSQAGPNDNRVPAGSLRDGVLTVALEVRQTMWYPDGDTLPGMTIDAFAEAGKDASVPGPLLRVPVGSEIRGSLHNALERDPITFYVAARVSREATGDLLDSMVVPAGETRGIRIRATTPGTYLYRATVKPSARRVLRIDGFLAGAFIVDSASVVGTPPDRILVLQAASDTLPAVLANLAHPVMAINGRSWPHTERFNATVGDTLRWRLINATTAFHPMHLHGSFYRVDAFDAEARGPQEGRNALGRMVVTERMPPASTMSISWVPERAGNWLFHCHFQEHVLPHRQLGTTAPTAGNHAEHVNHAMTGMGGLVLGVLVRPKHGEPIAEPPAGRRKLRLVAIRDAGFPDSLPSMRFVLEERGAGRLEAGPGFSPTISLTRGEPVSIMVVNRLPEPTAVHWHGIELESYFDGVAGFGGWGQRVAPIISPRDSFEVRMTPPRSGTFIYHSHVDEPRQHRAGLVGALIVRDRATVDSVEDLVFFVKGARAGSLASPEFEINGKQDPDTVVLRVGRRYRLRFIGLQVSNPNAAVSLTARSDSVRGNPRDTSLVQWRPVAKDAIELPEAERVLRSAREVISMGETYDFEFVPTKPGQLRIEVRVSVPQPRLMVRAPIRVQ